MEGFKEFLEDIKRFPVLFGFLITPPLTNLFLPIGPPEEVIWITFVTALFAAGTLMLVYLAFKKKSAAAGKKAARSWIIAGMALVFVYLLVVFLVVYRVPSPDGGPKRVAIGFSYLTPTVEKVAKSYPTVYEALEAYDYDPYRIYTPTSIAIIRLLLIALWVGCFCAGYGAIAYFIRAISHPNPNPAPPNPAPVPPNPNPPPNPNQAPQNPAPPPHNPAPAPPPPAQPKKNKPKKKQKPDGTK